MEDLLEFVGGLLTGLADRTREGTGRVRWVYQVVRALGLAWLVAWTVWLWHAAGPWPVAGLGLILALVLWLTWRRTHFTFKDLLTASRPAEPEPGPKPEWKPPVRYSVVLDG